MKKNILPNMLLLCGSLGLMFLLTEAALHVAVQPSRYSAGILFDRELPPYKLLPETPSFPSGNRPEWYQQVVVDGQQITAGDMCGIYREDSLLGYAPRENAVSVNGWWQSNNIGARAREATAPEKSTGKNRLLVFGESFGQGSRVRQEESWTAILDAEQEALEVVNLAVDGYSMAQAYLRYRTLRRQIDYDAVLMMFVPREDLWRDVNIRRDLGEAWWGTYLSMPRFILEDSVLKLIRPFPLPETYRSGSFDPDLLEQLQRHLRAYDRFYDPALCEMSGLPGQSILYKLLRLHWYQRGWNRQRKALLKPGSEALQVSREIFARMKADAGQDGKRFYLAILPVGYELKQNDYFPSVQKFYNRIAAEFTAAGIDCFNLLEELSQVPPSEIDNGYDGSHYGPRANRRIAGLIAAHLADSGLQMPSKDSSRGTVAGVKAP